MDATSRADHQHLDEVTRALESLIDFLDQEENLELILHQVCRQVVVAVPEADMASMTLIRDGKPETAAYTDARASDIDTAEYQSGAGPCLDAIATGAVVRLGVEGAAQRWSHFAGTALANGVTSYLAAPLVIDSETFGALNLYSHDDHGFHEVDGEILELFSTAVEGTLRITRRYLQARERAEQLREALTTRAVIDQAKGILMALHGIDADAAFDLLVQQSQRENTKVRQIAERFIETTTQLPQPGFNRPVVERHRRGRRSDASHR